MVGSSNRSVEVPGSIPGATILFCQICMYLFASKISESWIVVLKEFDIVMFILFGLFYLLILAIK